MQESGFYCPFCHSKISDDANQIVRFFGVLYGKKFHVGSFFELSATMGVYGGDPTYKELHLDNGAKVEFRCPHSECRHAFQAPYNSKLAEVWWVDEEGKKHVVAFNQTLGKEMTFVIDRERGEIVASHGHDRQEFIKQMNSYLGGPWFHRL